MILQWLNSVRYAWRTPAIIERRNVSIARARLQKHTLDMPCTTDNKQLLLDVSVICRHDAGTGIQRIVRAVLKQMFSDTLPAGYTVRPVAATRKQPYRYLDWDGVTATPDWGGKILIQPGDIFLGLDLSAHIIPAHRHQLAEWKEQGAALHFIVYDLLPLHHPEWFSGKLVAAFRRWIPAIAVLADSAICISRTVEAELLAWFEDRYGFAPGIVSTRVIPMGWDIATMKPSQGLPLNFDQDLVQIQERKTVLMVGTIEPRKGHAEVLDAFEQLWTTGEQTCLVIAGKQGWKVEALIHRLHTHPEAGKRLHWLDNPSDDVLLLLYQQCRGLIMASKGEGYGLPLIEAACYNKPMLVRDIPVFREIVGEAASYFSDTEPNSLEKALPQWLAKLEAKTQAPLGYPAWATWQESYYQLVCVLFPQHKQSRSNAHESMHESK